MTSYALQPRGDTIAIPTPPVTYGVGDSIDDSDDGRQALVHIYEHYAALCPNPDLSREREERDRLLRAAAAASSASGLNPNPQKVAAGRGFWSSWWPSPKDSAPEPKPLEKVDHENLIECEDDEPGHESDGSTLCGTQWSLDVSCIPKEAHSLARFHLASMRSRARAPNVARTSWEVAGTSVVTITGLGEVVECGMQQRFARCFTSDRDDLIAFAAAHQSDLPPFHPAYVRAALIGPNLLAVSWGLGDGVVVFYRRLAGDPAACVVWQARACVGPSEAVRENLADVFAEESSMGSPLLQVSDLVPLVVSTDQVPAATLAVSRLGGFLELVPLPPGMWYGPELTPPQNEARRHPHKRSKYEHYASNLVNLAAAQTRAQDPPITAISTSQYHRDITCMDCIRTRLEDNAELDWDEEAYPNAPPAEHILVAVGVSDDNEHEVASFWSIGTVLSGVPVASDGSTGFALHASLVEVMLLPSVGPAVTLFATPAMTSQWRRPRELRFRPGISAGSQPSAATDRVTTITVSAPITAMRFCCEDGQCFGTILDWNGGIQVLECGLLERLVSQSLTPEEYELLFRQNDPHHTIPLVKTLVHRSVLSQQLRRWGMTLPRVEDVRWVSDRRFPKPERCILALATYEPRTLSVTFVSKAGLDTLCAKVVLPRNKSGVLVTLRDGAIAVLSVLPEDSHAIYDLAVLDTLDPRSTVQALIQGSKFKEAIEAATPFADMEGVPELVEAARQELWKETLDVEVLSSILDLRFLVEEALTLDSRVEEIVGANDPFRLFRDIHLLSLKRLAASRNAPPTHVTRLTERLVRFGTYHLLCRQLSVQPSISRFCSIFLSSSIHELALAFAKSADLACLSIVYFRHRSDISKTLDVVSQIPVSVEPYFYHHLLPTCRPSTFLALQGSDPSLRDWGIMQTYLQCTFGISVLFDAEDSDLVLRRSNPLVVGIDSAAEWYTGRLRDISSFTSSVEGTIEFSRFGLAALGYSADPKNTDRLPSSAGYLLQVQRRARALRAAFHGDNSSTDFAPPFLNFPVVELETMDIGSLFDVTFRGQPETGARDVLKRYTEVFLPLVECLAIPSSGGALEGELSSFCTALVEGFALTSESRSSIDFTQALRLCASFCHLSRSSIDVATRLISCVRLLSATAESVFENTSLVCSTMFLSQSEVSEVLNCLWTVYEALPMRSSLGALDDLENVHDMADAMFERLVIATVVSKWSDGWILDQIHDRSAESLASEVSQVMSTSFCCHMKEAVGIAEPVLVRRFLESLTLDVFVLKRLRLFEGQPIHQLVTDGLIEGLLDLFLMDVIDLVLATFDEDAVDRQRVSSKLLAFVNQVVFSDSLADASANALRAAVTCRDILERRFPDTLTQVQESWRYLEATDFIRNVLLRGRMSRIRPDELRDFSPLDTIDRLLSCHAEIVVCDCEQWADPHQASMLNRRYRESLDWDSPFEDKLYSGEEALQGNTTALPGVAVLHLATLLGLDSEIESMEVMCLVVHRSCSAKLFGASAAVARKLLSRFCGSGAKQLAALIADAMITVLANDEFEDRSTKFELSSRCLSCLSVDPISLRTQDLQGLLRVFHSVEYGQVCATADSPSHLKHQLLLVERLFADTATDYAGTDLVGLFQTLQYQSQDLCVVGSLVVALSRFLFYWLITQSTRRRSFWFPSIEEPSFRSIISLATSLLVHVEDKEVSKETIRELSAILDGQTNENRSLVTPTPKIVRIDANLVDRLKGRGFSEFGARRALILTGSSSFEDALRWAVLHAGDEDFDKPILFLKPVNHAFVSNESIEWLEESLKYTMTLLSGAMEHFLVDSFPKRGIPMSLASNLDESKNSEIEIVEGKADPNQFSTNDDAATILFPAEPSRLLSKPPHARKPPISGPELEQSHELHRGKPINLQVSTSPILSLNGHATVQKTAVYCNQTAESRLPNLLVAHRSNPNDVPGASSPHRDSAVVTAGATKASRVDSMALERRAVVRSKRNTPTSASRLKKANLVVTTKPDSSEVARSSLLLRGQAVFNVSRKKSSPNAEERRRLIEAGRKLLQKTRPINSPTTPSSQSGLQEQIRFGNDSAPTATLLPPLAVAHSERTLEAEGNLPDQQSSSLFHVRSDTGVPSGANAPSNSHSAVAAGFGWDFDDAKPQEHALNSDYPNRAPAPPTVGGQPDHHPQSSTESQTSDHLSEGWDFDDQDEDDGVGGNHRKGKASVTTLPPDSSRNRDDDADEPANENGWDFEDDLT